MRFKMLHFAQKTVVSLILIASFTLFSGVALRLKSTYPGPGLESFPRMVRTLTAISRLSSSVMQLSEPVTWAILRLIQSPEQIAGNQFTFVLVVSEINYAVSAVATVDGRAMSGTFQDTQDGVGTFSLSNITPVLTPNLVLPNPPVVQLKNRTATFTCAKFSGIKTTAQALQRAAGIGRSAASSTAKTTIRYELTLKKGRTRQTLISTRNKVTVSNIKPGTYQISYRGQAVRNEKTIFSSKASPAAVFTVK